jgi:hypothetical protein
MVEPEILLERRVGSGVMEGVMVEDGTHWARHDKEERTFFRGSLER